MVCSFFLLLRRACILWALLRGAAVSSLSGFDGVLGQGQVRILTPHIPFFFWGGNYRNTTAIQLFFIFLAGMNWFHSSNSSMDRHSSRNVLKTLTSPHIVYCLHQCCQVPLDFQSSLQIQSISKNEACSVFTLKTVLNSIFDLMVRNMTFRVTGTRLHTVVNN